MISEEFLSELLVSEQFKLALTSMAEVTSRAGYETGFAVYRDMRNERAPPTIEDLIVTEKEVGSCSNLQDINIEETQKIEQEKFIPYEFIYELLDLHFHPACKGAIEPSGFTGDLCSLNNSYVLNQTRGIKARPIMTICQVDSKKSITMLLIQQKNYKPIPEALIDELEEDYEKFREENAWFGEGDECQNQRKIVDFLSATRFYNLQILKYKQGEYTLNLPKKLKPFAFEEDFNLKNILDRG